MLEADIKSKALEMGFTACGIIPAAALFEAYKKYLDVRVDTFPASAKAYRGCYAMATAPFAGKSVIVCTRRYNVYKIPEGLGDRVSKMYLMCDGRYYRTNTFPEKIEFEAYIKAAGMNISTLTPPARWAAALAGLAKFGRNNFVYDPEHGSYIWIESWLVDKELMYDPVPKNIYLAGCGDHCGKCMRACPTGAFSGGFSMDMRKCAVYLSYFTGALPPEDVWGRLGPWFYGCDACQDVCPHNKNKFNETEELPGLEHFEKILDPENIMEMDEDTYRNIVFPRFWFAGEDGLWLLKWNALRYMVNTGNAKYHETIKKCRDHPDERIKEIAEWGCDLLKI